ncbi:substrate-binding domain-containing protein [Glaciibacter sp. 2TAF33]|uniref:substrate-binding domain-containing protein n=1 Tax=Glaciibacter sp. 2TAF33 TaxID=3233015 RepID=UPI003F92D751
MKRINRLLGLTAAAAMTIGILAGCGTVGDTGGASAAGSGDGVFKIATVSKVEGISWFEAMRTGVDQFNDDNSDVVKAWQTGPDSGDPAKQVQIVEDLIAQGVDALVVIPNDPQSIAPVLKKARDAGIVVITHEAPALAGTDSVDYDLEAFDNAEFGQKMFEQLATQMGGKGKFVGEVGSLTSETHMAWYNAGVSYLKKNYPDITAVSDQPYEDDNDDSKARDNALEILKAYPDLGGFIGTSVSAGANFAAVLKEKNLTKIATSMLSLPSVAGPYLEEGVVGSAQAWNPAGAGYAANAVALSVLQKKALKTGADLSFEGYDSVTVDGKLITGSAILMIAKGTFPADNYPF